MIRCTYEPDDMGNGQQQCSTAVGGSGRFMYGAQPATTSHPPNQTASWLWRWRCSRCPNCCGMVVMWVGSLIVMAKLPSFFTSYDTQVHLVHTRYRGTRYVQYEHYSVRTYQVSGINTGAPYSHFAAVAPPFPAVSMVPGNCSAVLVIPDTRGTTGVIW